MEDIIRITEYDAPDLAERLRVALDVPRWIDEVIAHRPFSDRDALRAVIVGAAHPFTTLEIDHALGHHPRIGERPSRRDAGARHAAAEQSGVDTSDDDVATRLRDGNVAYERRFGRVFLVRAAGRTASDVLAELTRRLVNDEDAELREIESELRDIAALRLGVGA